MDSIEKLRDALNDCRRTEKTEFPFDTYWITADACDKCIDEIEREIAERYMELPLDADGVPIHPREKVSTGMGDDGPIGHLEYWYPNHWVAVIEYKPGQFTRYDPAAIRHVKPRTVEDVLHDCCTEWNEHCGNDWEQGVFAKYADELRGMGVGE